MPRWFCPFHSPGSLRSPGTADVQAFRDLPAFRADAAEGAAGPGFAGGWHEEFFFLTRFVEGAIGSGEEQAIGLRSRTKGENDANRQFHAETQQGRPHG